MLAIPEHEIKIIKNLATAAEKHKKFNEKIYNKLIKRRMLGEPIQYIEGKVHFFDLTINVDRSVLIPRPETEYFVEEVIKELKHPKKILDVGTGSGCIGLALKKVYKNSDVHLVDVSRKALTTSKKNAFSNHLEVKVYRSNLLNRVKEKSFDLIIANLPYIPTDDLDDLPFEISKFEPKVALDGGQSGLDKIKKLIYASGPKLKSDGLLALEIDSRQGSQVIKLMKDFREVKLVNDLTGRNRYVFGRK